jgi:hypothetical protein
LLLAAFLVAILVRATESALSEALGSYWLLGLGLLFVLTVIVFPRGVLGCLLALPLPARLARLAAEPPPSPTDPSHSPHVGRRWHGGGMAILRRGRKGQSVPTSGLE